jgi:hypothetical protein
MIIKEWQCEAHGDFEAAAEGDDAPGCPSGCHSSMVRRVFRTPPMVMSQGYRSINSSFEMLARDHNLSDMNNRLTAQNGTGMRRADADAHRRMEQYSEMIMHKAKALQGQDAGTFFHPVSQAAASTTGLSGAIHRDDKGRVYNDAGMVFSPPKPLVVGAHDGSNDGVAK